MSGRPPAVPHERRAGPAADGVRPRPDAPRADALGGSPAVTAMALTPPSYGNLVRRSSDLLAAASTTPRLDAELLVAHAAGAARSAVIAFPERVLDGEQIHRFASFVGRRCAGEPLAYIVGQKEFYSLTLAVGPGVLVPRPETEHLVDAALAALAGAVRPAVLDLGTGSGAIALAVKRQRPDAAVVGADASREALKVAASNGARLGLDVEWRASDWFAALEGRAFRCIVCNPPYLASDDPHLADLAFEPRNALDGGPDGLDAIRRVLEGAPEHLEAGGTLLIEHGWAQQDAVAALAERYGFELIEAGRDLEGRARFVVLAVKRRAR